MRSLRALVLVPLFAGLVLACDLGSLARALVTPVVVVITATPPPAAQTLLIQPTSALVASPAPATLRPPTARATPNFVLAYSDDFSSPEGGLPITRDTEYYYEEGEYILRLLAENIRTSRTKDDVVVSDFAMTLYARLVQGPDTAAWGIAFREQDVNNQYALLINGAGEYRLGKIVNKEWIDLGESKWVASPAIKTGGEKNRLTVMARGDLINALANGKELITVYDATFTKGLVGAAAQVGRGAVPVKVAFDDLSVTMVSNTSPATLLKDDFSNRATGWREWRRTGEMNYAQGQYIIRVEQPGQVVFGFYPKLSISDFSVEFEQHFIGAPGDGGGGVVFRGKDAANFYQFELNGQGEYKIRKLAGAQWQMVADMGWIKSPAIQTGGATNRVRVIAEGPDIALYVNDQYLTTVRDTSLEKGSIGFSSSRSKGGEFTVVFDNLRLYTTPGAALSIRSVPTTAPARSTTAPTLAAPRATATPDALRGLAPGVYVGALSSDPPDPKNGQYPTFHVTFVNSTGGALYYKWFVKIYEPEKTSSFGETAKTESTLPVGAARIASAANWKAPGAAPCRPFIARVFYQKADNSIHEFTRPDGGRPELFFSVCP